MVGATVVAALVDGVMVVVGVGVGVGGVVKR